MAQLKVMRCPSCGGTLRVEKVGEPLTCVYCDSTVIPEADASSGFGGGDAAKVRIDGIKTSASALAFVDNFIEDYDWSSSVYYKGTTIAELDDLVEDLRTTSADDKNTWLAAFKAAAVPFVKKAESTMKLYAAIADTYASDLIEAYSVFDVCRSSVKELKLQSARKKEECEKYLQKARKYGASEIELGAYRDILSGFTVVDTLPENKDLESIPQVAAYRKKEDEKITAAFAARGINAAYEYDKAIHLLENKQFTAALSALLPLRGYKDVNQKIDIADRLYHIDNLMESGEEFFYLEPRENGQNKTESLYLVEQNKLGKKLLKDVYTIVGNYATILYYLDSYGDLKIYDLQQKAEIKAKYPNTYRKSVWVNEKKKIAYLVTTKNELQVLQLATGSITPLAEHVDKVLDASSNHFVFLEDTPPSVRSRTMVVDCQSGETVLLHETEAELNAYVDSFAIYSVEAPSDKNKNLCIRDLKNPGSAPSVIAYNIYDFCEVLNGRVYYYVGSDTHKTLMSCDLNGQNKKSIPLKISTLLQKIGDYIYFIRSSGLNSAILRAHEDGTDLNVIAYDISQFEEIINGYLYFVNGYHQLERVRLDGTNSENLCSNVKHVISLSSEHVVYTSQDSSNVSSIYEYNFSDGCIRKLAYNVNFSKKYDDRSIYYTTEKRINAESRKQCFYKFELNQSLPQLIFERSTTQQSSGCYVATCVYGSYDCPEVWTLRRFRDNVLASTWYGRLFIRAYYAVSPTIVRIFGKTDLFRNFWRMPLDRMVEKLNDRGFENTAYDDPDWTK